MQWSDIQFSPSPRTLRQFAALWLIVFGALAAYEAMAGDRSQLAPIYGVAAVTVGGLGLVWPAAVRPIFVAWNVIAFPIGWTISTLTLAFLFYGVFTPLALAFWVSGRDALGIRRTQVKTYWKPKSVAKDPREYFRQS